MADSPDQPYDVDQYDSADEFIDSEFVGPDDFPDGVELPPEIMEGEHPDIEDARQVRDDWAEYHYKDHKVIIRREHQTKFECRVFIDDYTDPNFVKAMHHVEQHGYIEKVTDGVVYLTIIGFQQYQAMDAAEDLIDQYLEFDEGREQVEQALSQFSD